jgi:hypothetical protein
MHFARFFIAVFAVAMPQFGLFGQGYLLMLLISTLIAAQFAISPYIMNRSNFL